MRIYMFERYSTRNNSEVFFQEVFKALYLTIEKLNV